MTVTLKEVTRLHDLKTFIRFPAKLYQGNPYYVPALFFDELNTLRHDRNPAFEHCEARYWLAYKDGQLAGRVAAILNRRHIEKWGQKYLRFGWLDFVDDPEVSSSLLEAVETWGRAAGMEAVHGPLGFTDLDREGMLVEGFEEVATLSTNYNFPYYPAHMERLGYAKDTDWVEYEMMVPAEPDPTIARIADLARRRYKLHLLEAKNKRELLKYASELFDILDEILRPPVRHRSAHQAAGGGLRPAILRIRSARFRACGTGRSRQDGWVWHHHALLIESPAKVARRTPPLRLLASAQGAEDLRHI